MKVVHVFINLFVLLSSVYSKYEPNWDSLDSRPLPQWFDDAKIGIFLHWGVYSVPSYGGEWFWKNWKRNVTSILNFLDRNYPKTFKYPDFAKDFTAEFFNATQWAEIFANSGAKYVVLTAKHHEGYTMWPSKYSWNWNSKDIGPGRDLLGEIAAAVRAKDLTFGAYHSLYEWFNPFYLADKENSFKTQDFVRLKVMPELMDLIQTYKPAVIWSDGDWETTYKYWNSTNFLAWLYNESPVKDFIVTNDRWGAGYCIHGDFYSCADRFNPGVLLKHKWENAMTIDKMSWGFRRNAPLEDYYTTSELLRELATTISCGGNLLMNVGPTKDGIIPPIFQDRLKALGEWLAINGEAIYSSKPWMAQNDSLDSEVWYTSKSKTVYAIVLQWPQESVLELGSVVQIFKENKIEVTMLGSTEVLLWKMGEDKVYIKFPDKSTIDSKDAYVLKFENIV